MQTNGWTDSAQEEKEEKKKGDGMIMMHPKNSIHDKQYLPEWTEF